MIIESRIIYHNSVRMTNELPVKITDTQQLVNGIQGTAHQWTKIETHTEKTALVNPLPPSDAIRKQEKIF